MVYVNPNMAKIVITFVLVCMANATYADACVQQVMISLYGELEAIDVAGEERLIAAIDELAAQESWDSTKRSEFTLGLANNSDVEATESERTDILAKMFGTAQRDPDDCEGVTALRDQAIALEKAQWERAIGRVQQLIYH